MLLVLCVERQQKDSHSHQQPCLKHSSSFTACTPQEVEDTLVEFLEKGATVESDVLANVKTILPPEAATLLNELIPEPPNKSHGPNVVPVEPLDVTAAPAAPAVTYYQADVVANQIGERAPPERGPVVRCRQLQLASRGRLQPCRTCNRMCGAPGCVLLAVQPTPAH